MLEYKISRTESKYHIKPITRQNPIYAESGFTPQNIISFIIALLQLVDVKYRLENQ